MAENRSCYPESSICRGGWLLDDVCKYFWYVNKTQHINASGKALAGFQDTTLKVFSPSLSYLHNKELEDKAFKYGNTLFSGAGIGELDKPSLIGFKKVMIASLLENLENVINCCGINDVLVQKMYKAAECHDISLFELKGWGGKIRKERAILNGNREKNYGSFSDECARELAASRSQVADLKENIVRLERRDDEKKR